MSEVVPLADVLRQIEHVAFGAVDKQLPGSLADGELPGGGPVTVQPPAPSSNDVVSPVETAVSSMKTPSPWADQSLA